jgi:hypothetical protein
MYSTPGMVAFTNGIYKKAGFVVGGVDKNANLSSKVRHIPGSALSTLIGCAPRTIRHIKRESAVTSAGLAEGALKPLGFALSGFIVVYVPL